MTTASRPVAPDPIGASAAAGVAQFARLLVPTDFSPASRAALALALGLADQCGSEVVLFNAIGDDGNDEFLNHTGVPWGRGDVVDEAIEHLRRFADAVAPGASARVRVEAVRDGDPVRAIAGACDRLAPLLVVLGAPARPRRWRRSRSERLLRALSCSVLVVRGEPEPRVDADT